MPRRLRKGEACHALLAIWARQAQNEGVVKAPAYRRAKLAVLIWILAGGMILTRGLGATSEPPATDAGSAENPKPDTVAASADSGAASDSEKMSAPAANTLDETTADDQAPLPAKRNSSSPATVYVVPIQGEISAPQLYILRRALKSAIESHADAVVLDMDTLGGEMSVMLDMMDALAKFPGHTYTYVNDKALSAGSFIASATNEIYFKPGSSTIGAAAAVNSEGTDIDSTMKLKINSFMEAKVRGLTAGKRYRADVQRAMMDADFEFKVGDEVIKPKGALLTLTGEEACKTYGKPPEKLLGAGLAPDIDTLLAKIYGPGGFVLQEFSLSWSEQLAKWINAVAPILMGAGILLLLLEFKAPGFGLPGIAGICLLVIVLAGQYVAGLSGYEPAVLFVLGLVCLVLELFVFTGSALCGVLGILCFFASFVWAMTDVWPGQSFGGVTAEALAQPMLNLAIALLIAWVGFALALRFLPKTSFYGRLVNLTAVPRDSVVATSGGAAATGAITLPDPGVRGVAVTDLRPLGEIEIAGGRFQARAVHGQINRGAAVEVVGRKDFALAVKNAEN